MMDGEPTISILTGQLQEVVNKFQGVLTLAEVIGALEIVKINVYHSVDDSEDFGKEGE